jgi:hypothetical protein
MSITRKQIIELITDILERSRVTTQPAIKPEEVKVLDEAWLLSLLESTDSDLTLGLVRRIVMSQFPGIGDPESELLRVITDSELLSLETDTQKIRY